MIVIYFIYFRINFACFTLHERNIVTTNNYSYLRQSF
jgi:hypothetical protein